jgi:hypothetical protein
MPLRHHLRGCFVLLPSPLSVDHWLTLLVLVWFALVLRPLVVGERKENQNEMVRENERERVRENEKELRHYFQEIEESAGSVVRVKDLQEESCAQKKQEKVQEKATVVEGKGVGLVIEERMIVVREIVEWRKFALLLCSLFPVVLLVLQMEMEEVEERAREEEESESFRQSEVRVVQGLGG